MARESLVLVSFPAAQAAAGVAVFRTRWGAGCWRWIHRRLKSDVWSPQSRNCNSWCRFGLVLAGVGAQLPHTATLSAGELHGGGLPDVHAGPLELVLHPPLLEGKLDALGGAVLIP